MIRLLFLSDTHLGFDYPFNPRVERVRRGPDFFANFERALAPALDARVDAVVHGGDMFFRSKIPRELVGLAFAPLLKAARAGVPVFVVPGNHERSRIPQGLLETHPNIHIFNQPRTYNLELPGGSLALGGFPYAKGVQQGFKALVRQTGLLDSRAGVRVLCMHHCFEGARVGPVGYTFRGAPDVVGAADLPPGLACVLSRHIHRQQVIGCNLLGQKLPYPVIYSGSIERTAFAEKNEVKGYMLLGLHGRGRRAGTLAGLEFVPLPARPMLTLELAKADLSAGDGAARLKRRLAALPGNAVVQLRISGPNRAGLPAWLSAAGLRTLAPKDMALELALPRAPAKDAAHT
jgi:exonuclease SbcD